ncbi:glycosyltransferase family 4 protein [Rhodoferax mekongensis]|uniref:glycosyltransferase family 4 protein n=1 Tax=Rhodoferax mekongensis TaxID=3068341 RepID=UPI0028BE6821|nr:glycosyltransferase family 4 protein [Rhodoferax sp. TBRC 17199]MDT7516461.1 glycosyltransferase family 4 protein [Rhodoferax sp. TBRC 17199]
MHYRTKLFEQLRAATATKGIQLELVHGQATKRETVKKDEGSLPWAHKVVNKVWEFGERDILWQPYPAKLKDADLVVVMQESRILSNYPLLLSRLWSKRKVAYWGHGKNFQSDAPTGLRERWKNFLIRRVDWWFAYTGMTVDILTDAGYPKSQITCLDNAIDTSSFKADLASWSQADVIAAKQELGIPAGAAVGVFCGSLYPDKKLGLLVAAADLIRQRMPEFTLVVIGDGPSMPEMRDAAANRPWMHLLGVRKGREKALYFRMGDVMLNPGLVGLHIVDAFCAGMVMMTTRTARHSPEVAYLRDGENGVYSDDTAEAYSQAVLNVIEDKERLTRMKAAALADSEHYTLENMVERFANGIEAAVNG